MRSSALKIILIIAAAGILLAAANYLFPIKKPVPSGSQGGQSPVLSLTPAPQPSTVSTPMPTEIIVTPLPANPALDPPIGSALDRVTKKPFGIRVSSGNSPVSPERFSGYHTGVDFETFPSEENADVAISAACSGKAIYKNWVSGYGGVFIQSCRLEGQDITVLYGHLKLSIISLSVGQEIAAGEKIGILGKGYSSETDGERKHLHFSIHKGEKIDLKGYVQNSADLSGWLDAMKYLK